MARHDQVRLERQHVVQSHFPARDIDVVCKDHRRVERHNREHALLDQVPNEYDALFRQVYDLVTRAVRSVRVIDAFVDELDLAELGFGRATPADTGRPGYHPATLLKLYLYGYLNRVPSSHRLEREAQRNLEVLWLTGRLAPDFKTIANFRRDNGTAIKAVCRQFILLCRKLGLLADAVVAIDGSKFKAVNARDKSYTEAVVQRRMEQVEASVARYLRA